MEDKVIVIVGPTGVGKTKVSVALAKALNGEIISGDSVQIYKKLNIGSAKVTKDEMEGIPHHLIDCLELEESYSVADFQREVRQKIKEITARGKVAILAGGTGLYLRGVLQNYEFHGKMRNMSQVASFDSLSNEELFEKLKEVDPKSADKFHPNNRIRVSRAYEFYLTHGEPISLRDKDHEVFVKHVIIGLTMDRNLLYERINKRVDLMIEDGLIEEVKALLPDEKYIEAIGYNELFSYFHGQTTLEEAIAQIKQNSRRYAKRQYTWFRNQMNTNWIDVQNKSLDDVLDEVKNILKECHF